MEIVLVDVFFEISMITSFELFLFKDCWLSEGCGFTVSEGAS